MKIELMEIEIPYNGVIERIEFPDNVALLEAKSFPILNSETVVRKIEEGWEKAKNLFHAKKVSIIVNDGTRRVPTAAILKVLSRSIPIEQIEILVATGTHRAPTERELDTIFGDLRDTLENRVFVHDCHATENTVTLGKTSRGTLVAVNKKLIEAESVICINSVEPHFFAGFTGGRKSLVPGLASFGTVVANHSHAKSEHAESMNLEGNPVHLDLAEAAEMAVRMPVFSIQLVLSRDGDIVDLYCGDLRGSFEEACRKAKDVYSVEIEKKYDIVFAVGEPPLDANLYQLQKG
ncbi:MAG: lactate racemase domain-containing protein, partial [candidate division Zixibacteria bacterium]